MQIKIKILVILFLLPFLAKAQDRITAKKYLREGVESYRQSIDSGDTTHLAKAEISFKKAVEADPAYTDAMYDAGAALYKQGKYDDAAKTYEAVTKIESDKSKLAKTFYNIGNSYLQKKDYQKAVEAYKNALRNNPNDKETKYNLAYAQKMLKEQQQQGGNCNKDQNQDNKDQKQDKKQQNKENDKDKDNQDQQKQEQQKQDQEKKDKQGEQNKQNQQKEQQQKQEQQQGKEGEKQEQKQQSQAGKLSKKDAERLLQSIQRNEDKLQQKLSGKKEKKKGKRIKIEKDW